MGLRVSQQQQKRTTKRTMVVMPILLQLLRWRPTHRTLLPSYYLRSSARRRISTKKQSVYLTVSDDMSTSTRWIMTIKKHNSFSWSSSQGHEHKMMLQLNNGPVTRPMTTTTTTTTTQRSSLVRPFTTTATSTHSKPAITANEGRRNRGTGPKKESLCEKEDSRDNNIASSGGVVPTTTTSPTTMEDHWREWTSRLLLDPSSRQETSSSVFLSPSQSSTIDQSIEFHMIETCILYWTEQRTLESVLISLDLLEQLAVKATATATATANNDDDISIAEKRTVNIYIVHAILKNWSTCMRLSSSSSSSNNNNRRGKRSIEILSNTTNNKTLLPLPSQVLNRIHKICNEISPGLFVPNIATYTMILDGASNCPNPEERIVFSRKLVEELWEKSRQCTESWFSSNTDLRPTIVTFGTLIKGLSKSKSVSHAEEAERWLRRIEEIHEEQQQSFSGGGDDLRPNTVIYTNVIHAWANVGKADRAEALLQEMYLKYHQGKNPDVRPTLKTFNTVLSAWSKSSSPDAYKSAFDLFDLMNEFSERHRDGDLRPDIVTYNCLLSTIATRPTHHDAVDRAESIMEMILSTTTKKSSSSSSPVKPTKVTYLVLFRILAASGISDNAERAQRWLSLSNSKSLAADDDLLRHVNNM